MNIRKARKEDLNSITEIYNQSVKNSTATFDTQEKTLEEQAQWLKDHDDQFPVWVYEENASIRGWVSVSRWSGRCAYSETGEVSIFIHRDFCGKGIGKKLLTHAIEESRNKGLHSLLSRLAEGNEASTKLHELLGFQKVGTMKEVGKKFGKRLDVDLYQIMLS